MNSQRMHYYVRLSGDNKPVVGSLVSRTKMPKDGHWIDISAYLGQCCFALEGSKNAPTNPANFAAAQGIPSATVINLSWSVSPNATGYIVEKSTSFNFSTNVTTAYTGTGTSTSVTGLTASTNYYFRIKATALNPHFNSTYSYASRATTA